MEIVLKQQIEGFAGAPYVYTYPPLRAFTRQKIFPLETPRFTENLNIYVHVPFCDQQCTFCGYLTAIERSTENKLKYARAVAEEILLYAPLIKRSRITSINFGGGTPSVLPIDGIAHILETLRSINPDISHTAREISIESTPERVSTEWAKDIRRLGFNRLSIGIQSIVDREIGRSGRHNKISVSLEAVNAARLAQIPNLCCDLMYGLEWQTVETWQRSVEILLSLAPETIELYRTVSIPGTIFPVRSASTMTEKEKYKCFIFARDLFLAYGYEQETHLRFVLPGRGFYQQQTNVFAGESLLGIGVGARTYAENMHYRNIYDRTRSTEAIAEYIKIISEGKFAVETAFTFSANEAMRRYAIFQLDALDLDDFHQQFGVSFSEVFPQAYANLLELGLAQIHQSKLVLTEKGTMFRDVIAQTFYSEEVGRLERSYYHA